MSSLLDTLNQRCDKLGINYWFPVSLTAAAALMSGNIRAVSRFRLF